MQQYSERASIVMWLKTQEQAISIWIDEVLSRAPADSDLLEKLDTHRRWLTAAIDDLGEAKAA